MAEKTAEPVGRVTHFYDKLGVAIVKFDQTVPVGAKVSFKGHTTDLKETIGSMQFDHSDIAEAKPGQEVGIRVSDRVREGDQVFLEK